MRAGLLQEQIEILHPTLVKNDFGEETTEWKITYKTRARLLHISGNRTNENNEIVFPYVKTFEVRDYVPVGEYDRIVWNKETYRILDITPDKTQKKLTIKTQIVND